jgi:hypothetical protein
VAEEHLAGDLDVDGIDVVEQSRSEEAADLKDKPGEEEDCEGERAPAAGGLNGGCQFSSQSVVYIDYWSSGRSV